MRHKHNTLCPCGSGHKYKKCCGRAPTEEQRRRWTRIKELFLTGK
jgi:uncharacterized protein YchJ